MMDHSSRKNWEGSFKFAGFLADIPDLSEDSQDVDHNHNILQEIYCSQYYTDMNYLENNMQLYIIIWADHQQM